MLEQQENSSSPKSERDLHLLFKIVVVGEAKVGKSSLLQSYKGNNEFSPNPSSPAAYVDSTGDGGDSFLIKDIKIGDVTVSTHIWEIDPAVLRSSDSSSSSRTRRTLLQQTDALVMVADLTSVESVVALNDLYCAACRLIDPVGKSSRPNPNPTGLHLRAPSARTMVSPHSPPSFLSSESLSPTYSPTASPSPINIPVAIVGNKIDLYNSSMDFIMSGLQRWVDFLAQQTMAAGGGGDAGISGPLYFETSAKLGLNVKEVFHRLVRVLLQKYTLTSALLSESSRRPNLTPMTAGQGSQGRLRYTCESTSENLNDDDIIEFSDLNPLRARVRSSRNKSTASIRDNLTCSFDEEPLSPQPHSRIAKNGLQSANLTGFKQENEVLRMTVMNIALSGMCGVGKSTLLSRFCSNTEGRSPDITAEYAPTSGVAFKSLENVILPGSGRDGSGCTATLNIWDLSGQANKMMNTLEVAVYQDVHCLLLMFDLTSAASFDHLDAALSKFLSVQSQRPRSRSKTGSKQLDFAVVLVGSKSDLTSSRAVSQEKVRSWCHRKRPKRPIPYIECSSLDNVNVGQVFALCVSTAKPPLRRGSGGTDGLAAGDLTEGDDDDSEDSNNMLTRPSARLSTATHVVDQGGRGLRSSPADAKDKAVLGSTPVASSALPGWETLFGGGEQATPEASNLLTSPLVAVPVPDYTDMRSLRPESCERNFARTPSNSTESFADVTLTWLSGLIEAFSFGGAATEAAASEPQESVS